MLFTLHGDQRSMKCIPPWYRIASKLKPAFSNNRAFNLSILLLLGISTRKDQLGGVTSLARALPLSQTKRFYQRSLDLSDLTCRVKEWRGTICVARFHSLLAGPDVRISRIRLSFEMTYSSPTEGSSLAA